MNFQILLLTTNPLFPGTIPFEPVCPIEEISIWERTNNEIKSLTEDQFTLYTNNDQFENSDQEYDDDDDDDIPKYRGVNRKCLCCGKDQNSIREWTHKESLKYKKKMPKIKVRHWLGISVEYFCLLHCSQRYTERILFIISQNDESKCSKIAEELKKLKMIRSSWNFRQTKSGRFYPQFIFGEEVKSILDNWSLFLSKLPWLNKWDKKLFKFWEIV